MGLLQQRELEARHGLGMPNLTGTSILKFIVFNAVYVQAASTVVPKENCCGEYGKK